MDININAASETSGAAMRRKKREFENRAKEGAKLLATDGEWELWTPETFEASVYLARKGVSRDDWARWDTAYEGGGAYYFNWFTKKGPLYIFINKSNPKEKYQYHAETNSFYNQYDRQSDFDSFICAHPAFADYFGIECDEDIEGCTGVNCATKYGADMCSIGASEDAVSETDYCIYYNGDVYDFDSDFNAQVAKLKSMIDTEIAKGNAQGIDFAECQVTSVELFVDPETNATDYDWDSEEVEYCADADDDYADYI